MLEIADAVAQRLEHKLALTPLLRACVVVVRVAGYLLEASQECSDAGRCATASMAGRDDVPFLLKYLAVVGRQDRRAPDVRVATCTAKPLDVRDTLELEVTCWTVQLDDVVLEKTRLCQVMSL